MTDKKKPQYDAIAYKEMNPEEAADMLGDPVLNIGANISLDLGEMPVYFDVCPTCHKEMSTKFVCLNCPPKPNDDAILTDQELSDEFYSEDETDPDCKAPWYMLDIFKRMAVAQHTKSMQYARDKVKSVENDYDAYSTEGAMYGGESMRQAILEVLE